MRGKNAGWRVRAGRFVCLVSVLLALPVTAQTPAETGVIVLPPSPPPSLSPQPRLLETITVTAQKTEQQLGHVPASVSVVEGEKLRAAAIFDAGRLEERAVNIEIDADPQAPVIGMRGVSTDTDNVGFEPSVGLLLDDVPMARSEFITDGLFDVQRVEILRGPQGALFGKNTIAGVLGFFTVEPMTDGRGRLDMSRREDGGQQIELGQNLPLGEVSALRLAGSFRDQPGDVYNSRQQRREGNFTQKAGRLKVLSRLSETLTLRASTQLSRTQARYGPNQLYAATDAVLAFNRQYDAEVEDDPFDQRNSLDAPGFVTRDTQVSRLILEADAPFAWSAMRSTLILAHADFDIDTLIDADISPASAIITDFAVRQRQNSLEWRVENRFDSLWGKGRAVDLVLGVYAAESDMFSNLDAVAGEDLLALGATPAGLQALGLPLASMLPAVIGQLPVLPGVPLDDALLRDYTQRADSYAVFGQADWALGEHWSLIAGARLNRERKRAAFDVRTQGPGLITLILGAEDFADALSRSETDISPKLGAVYRWDENLQAYAAASTGFKGGGYNAIANGPDDLAFEPEEARSLEAGLRWKAVGGRLRTHLSVYMSRVRNLQVVDLLENALVVSNAAEAELSGLETEVSWLPPLHGLRLDAGLGLSDARYRDYRNAVPTSEQSDDGQTVQDLSGRTLPDAPRVTAFFEPSVEVPLPVLRGVSLRVAVNAVYRGDQYLATDLDPRSFQKGYWLFGAFVQIAPPGEAWALRLSGSNLGNELALDRASDNAVYADTYEGHQIPGRRVWLGVSANW